MPYRPDEENKMPFIDGNDEVKITDDSHHWSKRYAIQNPLVRQFLAEFIGTAILIIVGDGSVAQSVLSHKEKGGFLSVNIGWGMAVMIAVFVSGGVSGGHINPAISLGQFMMGQLRGVQLIVYMAAQYLGAFVGAGVVCGVYYQSMNVFDGGTRMVGGVNGTAGIFATYPADYLDWAGGMGDQIVGTWLLAMGVAAITDPRNTKVPSFLAPLLVGLVVLAVGLSYGVNCGYAINPARDLAPRLWTLIAGWGDKTFSYNDWTYFWVPIIGPHIGAVLGFLTYNYTVAAHWPM